MSRLRVTDEYGNRVNLLRAPMYSWRSRGEKVRKTNDGKNWRAIWYKKDKLYTKVFGPTEQDKNAAYRYAEKMGNYSFSKNKIRRRRRPIRVTRMNQGKMRRKWKQHIRTL